MLLVAAATKCSRRRRPPQHRLLQQTWMRADSACTEVVVTTAVRWQQKSPTCVLWVAVASRVLHEPCTRVPGTDAINHVLVAANILMLLML